MITYKHKEPQALQKSERTSDTRALYLDEQVLVETTFEMDCGQAWKLFNQLPEHILPVLPSGYRWVFANDNYSIIRNRHVAEQDIKLVLYGPDKESKINFICLIDGVTTYSFAHTQRSNRPGKANPPMSTSDFRVVGYNYSSKKYKQHVRGHLIDHQDTIMGVPTLSTNDPRNYVPEPPEYEWGLGIRRLKVKELRDQGNGAYAQLNHYPTNPLKTVNGTWVPEDVRLYAFHSNEQYTPMKHLYHVEFEENMKRRAGETVLGHANACLSSSLEAAPVVATYVPEESDRSARLKIRNQAKKESSIVDRTVYSRYLQKDRVIAACDTADGEFETAGHQLHAGIVNQVNHNSKNYMHRSLFFARKLNDLDDGDLTVYSTRHITEGKRFFRGEGKDLEQFCDEFRQLTS